MTQGHKLRHPLDLLTPFCAFWLVPSSVTPLARCFVINLAAPPAWVRHCCVSVPSMAWCSFICCVSVLSLFNVEIFPHFICDHPIPPRLFIWAVTLMSCELNWHFSPANRSQEGAGPVAPDRKSLTLPVSRNRAGILHARLQQLGTLENAHTFNNSKMFVGHSNK